MQGLDPKHVGIIHDAGNMIIEGFENWRLGLEILGEYLAAVRAGQQTPVYFGSAVNNFGVAELLGRPRAASAWLFVGRYGRVTPG